MKPELEPIIHFGFTLNGKEFNGGVSIKDEDGSFIGHERATQRLHCVGDAVLRRYYRETNTVIEGMND